MKVETSTRRANLLVFIGLVVFAIALCAVILLWMRARTRAMGGKVYPPTTTNGHPWRPEVAIHPGNPFSIHPLRMTEVLPVEIA